MLSGISIIVLIVSLLAFSTAQQGENIMDKYEKEAPFTPAYLIDDEDTGGEICDPSKQNACELPLAECVWSPRDMMYKCRRESKRNVLRKRQTKQKKSVLAHTTPDTDQKIAERSTENTIIITSKPAVVANHVLKSSGKGRSIAQPLATSGMQLASAEELSRAEQPKDLTKEVPEYRGSLTWDGKSENSETCIPKHEMAENLQEFLSMAAKEHYIEINEEQICDFEKFFHCTIEEESDTELEIQDNVDLDPNDNTPMCRCYESAMPVVGGECYIPADFGTKSACGETVIIPYPIQPWKGAPLLKPKCTPNSDCKESQYWFGKRCTCRYNAKWNSQTHTCDNGMRCDKSIVLLTTLLFIIFIPMHFQL